MYVLVYGEQNVVQRVPEISHHHLSVVAMAVSPCNKLVALLTDAGNKTSITIKLLEICDLFSRKF